MKVANRKKIELSKWAALPANPIFTTVLMIALVVSPVFALRSVQANAGPAVTVAEKYPGLAAGVLKSAQLKAMPAGIVLKSDRHQIRESELQEQIAGAEPEIRAQLKKNLFFLLEQEITMKILVTEARNAGANTEGLSDSDALKSHLDRISQQASVSETEIKTFYEANREMIGDVPFDQIKDSLHEFLLQQKKSETVHAYITGLGSRTTIRVNENWAAAQYQKAQDNPVDRARTSGKPSMVEFGANGCNPCDRMQPILEKLSKNYPDSLNVVFVHVRKEQILAARFGIRAIPVQVFFDRNGKETFRHEGFFPEKEVRKQLAQIGIK